MQALSSNVGEDTPQAASRQQREYQSGQDLDLSSEPLILAQSSLQRRYDGSREESRRLKTNPAVQKLASKNKALARSLAKTESEAAGYRDALKEKLKELDLAVQQKQESDEIAAQVQKVAAPIKDAGKEKDLPVSRPFKRTPTTLPTWHLIIALLVFTGLFGMTFAKRTFTPARNPNRVWRPHSGYRRMAGDLEQAAEALAALAEVVVAEHQVLPATIVNTTPTIPPTVHPLPPPPPEATPEEPLVGQPERPHPTVVPGIRFMEDVTDRLHRSRRRVVLMVARGRLTSALALQLAPVDDQEAVLLIEDDTHVWGRCRPSQVDTFHRIGRKYDGWDANSLFRLVSNVRDMYRSVLAYMRQIAMMLALLEVVDTPDTQTQPPKPPPPPPSGPNFARVRIPTASLLNRTGWAVRYLAIAAIATFASYLVRTFPLPPPHIGSSEIVCTNRHITVFGFDIPMPDGYGQECVPVFTAAAEYDAPTALAKAVAVFAILALIVAVQFLAPWASELSEELMTDPAFLNWGAWLRDLVPSANAIWSLSYQPRMAVALVEFASNYYQLRTLWCLCPVLLHLVCALIAAQGWSFGVPIQLAIHCAYNSIVGRETYMRTETSFEKLSSHGSNTLADQSNNLRTFDREVGKVKYANKLIFCNVHFDMNMRVLGMDFGRTRTTWRELWISRELYGHLLSQRISCQYDDEPSTIKARLEAMVRSFVGLGEDRLLGDTRWAANTLEVAYRTILAHNQSVSTVLKPHVLYGAAASHLYRYWAPGPSIIYGLIPRYGTKTFEQHASPEEQRDRTVVSKQIFAAPNVCHAKWDPKDHAANRAGIHRRLAAKTPDPDPKVLKELKDFTVKFLRARGITPLAPDTTFDFEEWLAGTNYTEARKEQLREAKKRGAVARRDGKLLAKDKKVSSFTKDEFYSDPKPPRFINARTDYYKTWIGPYVQKVEKVLFSMLPEVIKKVPVDQRPAYIREKLGRLDGIWTCTDFSSYESTHKAAVVRAVIAVVYEYMFSECPEALERIKKHVDVRCENSQMTSSDYIIYLSEAILMSGEMDTSLNNTMYNIITAYYFLAVNHAAQGLPFDLTTQRGVFEGDDGLLHQPEELSPSVAQYATAGAICKMARFEDMSKASFCGIIFDEKDMRNIRDPRAWLCTFPYTARADARCGPKRARQLLLAKAMASAYQYNGCPVISPIAWSIVRRLGHLDASKVIRNEPLYKREIYQAAQSYVRNHAEIPPGDSSRSLVEEMFNLSVATQLSLEATLPLMSENAVYVAPWEAQQNAENFAHMHSLGAQASAAETDDWVAAPGIFQAKTSLSLRRGEWWALRVLANFLARAISTLSFPSVRLNKSDQSLRNEMNVKPKTKQALAANPARETKAQAIANAARATARVASSSGHTPSDGITRAAEGAERIAGVIEAFAKAGYGRQTGQSAPREGARGSGLVRMDLRASQNLRSDSGQGAPRTNRTPLAPIHVLNESGLEVQTIKRFASSAERESESAPVASGTKMGPSHMETEYTDKRGNVVRATGHVLLSTVRSFSVGTTTGRRLGYFLMNPAAIGGRLGVLSTTFQQHKCRRIRAEYVPVVPTTTSGAIAMYFLQDVESPQIVVGTDELRHASTHDQFISTPVWQGCFLDARPSDLNRRYSSDTTGDPLASVQGALVIESAADLDADTDYGNLYLHYDFEFFAGALQYSEGSVKEFDVLMQVTAAGQAALSELQFLGPCQPGSPAPIHFAGALTQLDSTNYFLVMRVKTVTVPPATIPPTWIIPDQQGGHNFSEGQVFYLAFINPAASSNFVDGSINALLFASIPSGQNLDTPVNIKTSAVTSAVNTSIVFSVRAVPIDY